MIESNQLIFTLFQERQRDQRVMISASGRLTPRDSDRCNRAAAKLPSVLCRLAPIVLIENTISPCWHRSAPWLFTFCRGAFSRRGFVSWCDGNRGGEEVAAISGATSVSWEDRARKWLPLVVTLPLATVPSCPICLR